MKKYTLIKLIREENKIHYETVINSKKGVLYGKFNR